MTDERKASVALIVGSLGGILTMSIHPTIETDHLGQMSGVAHSLALLSVLVLFLGACGLTFRLASPDRLAFIALITYGFAAIGVMIAAAISGFAIPDALHLMERDVPSAAPQWRIAIATLFQLNQGLSRLYSIGGAAAIALWSVCCLRSHRLSRMVALYGCITAPIIIVLIAIGHLRLNVHGMAIVMVSQVTWFIGVGVGLWRVERSEATIRHA